MIPCCIAVSGISNTIPVLIQAPWWKGCLRAAELHVHGAAGGRGGSQLLGEGGGGGGGGGGGLAVP